MKQITAEIIMHGVRTNDNEVFKFIYKSYFPSIKFFVITNSGDITDAEDIFQEAIYLLLKKAPEEHLSLTCTFKTYLFSVCRNLWLQTLTKRKQMPKYDISDCEGWSGLFHNPFAIPDPSIDYCLFEKHFIKLSPKCRRILELCMEQISFETIAKMLLFKSRKIAINGKYKCLKILMDYILDDPEFIKRKRRSIDCAQYNQLKEKFQNGSLSESELNHFRAKMRFGKKIAIAFLERN